MALIQHEMPDSRRTGKGDQRPDSTRACQIERCLSLDAERMDAFFSAYRREPSTSSVTTKMGGAEAHLLHDVPSTSRSLVALGAGCRPCTSILRASNPRADHLSATLFRKLGEKLPAEGLDGRDGARSCRDTAGHVRGSVPGPAEVARLLADGSIVGVARAKAEFGPRALGNRSILCYPDRAKLKDRLNCEVKFREWYCPFAPTGPVGTIDQFAIAASDSPYMSFAPQLTAAAKLRFPAIAHIDGTARIQTVSRRDNEWFHDLLVGVGSITGSPILLNTRSTREGNRS